MNHQSTQGVSIVYSHNQLLHPFEVHRLRVPLHEDAFRRFGDNGHVNREHFLMALASIETIMIRARYVDEQFSTRLANVQMEVGVDRRLTPSHLSLISRKAFDVERCECPKGYTGTSCESCASGYRRALTINPVLYMGLCEPTSDREAPSIRIESSDQEQIEASQHSTLNLKFSYTVSSPFALSNPQSLNIAIQVALKRC